MKLHETWNLSDYSNWDMINEDNSEETKKRIDEIRKEGIGQKNWKLIKQLVIEVHDIDNRYDKIAILLEKEGFKLKILKERSLKETNLLNIYATR